MCLISLGYQSEADDDDEPAYRTWDFLLLAKSRLQRLDDTSADWASSDSQDWTSTNNADRTASTNSEDWSAAAEDNTGQGYYNHHDDDSQKKPSGIYRLDIARCFSSLVKVTLRDFA